MEKKIEQKLRQEIKNLGGLAFKFTSPGIAGVPDRIVLIPGGKIMFVELKAPGNVMRPLQLKRKSELESLGFKVYCIDSFQGVEAFIKEVFE